MRYLALVLLVVGGCAEFHVAVFCYVCAVVAMLWDIFARLANDGIERPMKPQKED